MRPSKEKMDVTGVNSGEYPLSLASWQYEKVLRGEFTCYLEPLNLIDMTVTPEEGFINVEPDGTVWGRSREPYCNYEEQYCDFEVVEIVFPQKISGPFPDDRLWIRTEFHVDDVVSDSQNIGSNVTISLSGLRDVKFGYYSCSDDGGGIHLAHCTNIRMCKGLNINASRMPRWMSSQFELPKLRVSNLEIMRFGSLFNDRKKLNACVNAHADWDKSMWVVLRAFRLLWDRPVEDSLFEE